jgi:hypothetical protein
MDIKSILRISLNLLSFAVLYVVFTAGSNPITGLAVAIALLVAFYGFPRSIDSVFRVFRFNRRAN